MVMRLSSIASLIALCAFAFPSTAHASLSQEREMQKCAETGGSWIRLDAGCIQMCGEGEPDCASWRLHGCDCGERMCWNGRGCSHDYSMDGAHRPRVEEGQAGSCTR